MESIAQSSKKRGTAKITVVARKRPLLPNEIQNGCTDSVLLDPNDDSRLSVSDPRKDITGQIQLHSQKFQFDRVYGASHNTETVYLDCVLPLIEKFIHSGGKNSIFTYGQTGSGKSYSMLGCPTQYKSNRNISSSGDIDMESCRSPSSGKEDKSRWGFLQHSVQRIFEDLDQNPGWLRLSCYEIFNNKIFDLLNDRNVLKPLEGRAGEVSVHGLEFVYCSSPNTVLDLVTTALKTRIVGSNARNRTSSRGHLVATLEIVDELPPGIDNACDGSRVKVTATNQTNDYGHPPPRNGGKIAFIDLAGTERGSDTLDRIKPKTNSDGACINKSLLALKECFRAIDGGKSHVPFRNSQLTKVLREFLVPEDACTVMMAHLSPASLGIESALNALQYTSMVMDLRRRCSPLLGCPPPLAHHSELYTVIAPKNPPLQSDDTGGLGSRTSRLKRRFTTLPPELQQSLQGGRVPNQNKVIKRSSEFKDASCKQVRPPWQSTTADIPSSNNLRGPGVNRQRTSLKSQRHDESNFDDVLPSPINHGAEEFQAEKRKSLSSLGKSKRTGGLAPPTPRPTSGGPHRRVGPRIGLTTLTTPHSMCGPSMISPKSIPTFRSESTGVRELPVLTPNQSTDVPPVPKKSTLSQLGLDEVKDIADEIKVGTSDFIEFKNYLLAHMTKLFSEIESSTNDPSTGDRLRQVVGLEAKMFTQLKHYLIEYERSNAMSPSRISPQISHHNRFSSTPTFACPPPENIMPDNDDEMMDETILLRGKDPTSNSPHYPSE